MDKVCDVWDSRNVLAKQRVWCFAVLSFEVLESFPGLDQMIIMAQERIPLLRMYILTKYLLPSANCDFFQCIMMIPYYILLLLLRTLISCMTPPFPSTRNLGDNRRRLGNITKVLLDGERPNPQREQWYWTLELDNP